MEIKDYLTTRNFTKRNNRKIEYIVIHYVGAVSSALNNAKYFKSTYRGSSAHYFVDEKDIYRVVADKDNAWHCGASRYKHAKCRNSNSIGIEMCCFKNDNVIDISEKVVGRTIELTKELMAKYNIPIENVLRHYDVTGKNCPAPFVSNVARWNNFKARLVNVPQTTNQANTTTSSVSTEYKVGDKVKVSSYYASSTDPVSKAIHRTAEGTITKIVEGARNPYLLNNGAIGWCNDGDIRGIVNTVSYYPKCSSKHVSLVNALNSIGVNSSFSNRKKIANKNGIGLYVGTATQNNQLLDKLKAGRLRKI
jgi:N-acetylmuramoyl-L-alanine amidase